MDQVRLTSAVAAQQEPNNVGDFVPAHDVSLLADYEAWAGPLRAQQETERHRQSEGAAAFDLGGLEASLVSLQVADTTVTPPPRPARWPLNVQRYAPLLWQNSEHARTRLDQLVALLGALEGRVAGNQSDAAALAEVQLALVGLHSLLGEINAANAELRDTCALLGQDADDSIVSVASGGPVHDAQDVRVSSVSRAIKEQVQRQAKWEENLLTQLRTVRRLHELGRPKAPRGPAGSQGSWTASVPQAPHDAEAALSAAATSPSSVQKGAAAAQKEVGAAEAARPATRINLQSSVAAAAADAPDDRNDAAPHEVAADPDNLNDTAPLKLGAGADDLNDTAPLELGDGADESMLKSDSESEPTEQGERAHNTFDSAQLSALADASLASLPSQRDDPCWLPATAGEQQLWQSLVQPSLPPSNRPNPCGVAVDAPASLFADSSFFRRRHAP